MSRAASAENAIVGACGGMHGAARAPQQPLTPAPSPCLRPLGSVACRRAERVGGRPRGGRHPAHRFRAPHRPGRRRGALHRHQEVGAAATSSAFFLSISLLAQLREDACPPLALQGRSGWLRAGSALGVPHRASTLPAPRPRLHALCLTPGCTLSRPCVFAGTRRCSARAPPPPTPAPSAPPPTTLRRLRSTSARCVPCAALRLALPCCPVRSPALPCGWPCCPVPSAVQPYGCRAAPVPSPNPARPARPSLPPGHRPGPRQGLGAAPPPLQGGGVPARRLRLVLPQHLQDPCWCALLLPRSCRPPAWRAAWRRRAFVPVLDLAQTLACARPCELPHNHCWPQPLGPPHLPAAEESEGEDQVAAAKATLKASLAQERAQGSLLRFRSGDLESRYQSWYSAGQVRMLCMLWSRWGARRAAQSASAPSLPPPQGAACARGLTQAGHRVSFLHLIPSPSSSPSPPPFSRRRCPSMWPSS